LTRKRIFSEIIGQVEDVYPGGEKLAEDFLLRRAAGNGKKKSPRLR
jgi:hypothetical protein